MDPAAQEKKEAAKQKSKKSRDSNKVAKKTTADLLISSLFFLLQVIQSNAMNLNEIELALFKKLTETVKSYAEEAPNRSAKDKNINQIAENLRDICELFFNISQKTQSRKRSANADGDDDDDPPAKMRNRSSEDNPVPVPATPISLHTNEQVLVSGNGHVTVYKQKFYCSMDNSNNVSLSSDVMEKLKPNEADADDSKNSQPTAAVNSDSDRVVVETGEIPDQDCDNQPGPDPSDYDPYPEHSHWLRIDEEWYNKLFVVKKTDVADLETSDSPLTPAVAKIGNVKPIVEEVGREPESGDLVDRKPEDTTSDTDTNGLAFSDVKKSPANPGEQPFQPGSSLHDAIQSALDDPNCNCV